MDTLCGWTSSVCLSICGWMFGRPPLLGCRERGCADNSGAWGVNVNVDVGNCGETSALSPALAETDRWEAGLARSWAW